jgi:hypothetical protein
VRMYIGISWLRIDGERHSGAKLSVSVTIGLVVFYGWET